MAQQTGVQRLVKWTIRLLLPVFTLGGFGGVASLSAIYSDRSQVVSATWSPTGKYRASVVELEGADGCLSGKSYVVYVERQWAHIKTGGVSPLCFAGPASALDVHWSGPEDLVMVCRSCDVDRIWYDGSNWGRLHYQYGLGRN